MAALWSEYRVNRMLPTVKGPNKSIAECSFRGTARLGEEWTWESRVWRLLSGEIQVEQDLVGHSSGDRSPQ